MSVTLPAGCTRARIERRLSADGVAVRIDDDADSLTGIMEDAWVEVQEYLSNLYSDAQIGTNEWVLKQWTSIAVMELCERRGNPAPASVTRKYDKAIKKLEQAQGGAFHVPGAATRKALAPTLSNQRVRLQPHPHIATTPHNSTGTASGYPQKTDPNDYEPNPYG